MNETHGMETLIANAAIRAAELHLADSGITVEPQRLIAALKAELVEQWPQLLQEWRDAIDAHMPPAMLRHILNVDANHIAVMAITRARAEEEGEEGQGLIGLIVALAVLAIILVMAARALGCEFDLSAITRYL